MLAALSLALSMLGALAVTTSAAPNPSGGDEAYWDGDSIPPLFGATPSDDFCAVFGCDFWDGAFDDGAQEVYFPAVGNADESTGLGAAQTSITVQNLSVDDAYIFIYVGYPEDDDGIDLDNWDVVEYAYLSGGASKTFQASDLEIPSGEIRPVVVAGYNEVDDEGEGLYLEPVILAGVAKQAVTGDSLPYTTAADTSVSGYNAIGGRELGYFDQLYFPIVQTNCGPGGCWNSILRIANMGLDDNAAVTVRFFPADDGSGSLQTGFQLQGLVDVGETWSIDLSEWVPEGWVGSAHVYTDDAVGAIVDRVKVGTDMWITNTASNANYEVGETPEPQNEVSAAYPYVLFAPDVRTDYNGWNTGINVANTVDFDTDVSIQYFGSNGNAPAAQTRRLAAQGMTYFYNPSDPSEDRCDQPATDVPGCEFIGGAIILSTNPVAVAVDGVKYFGNDANVGQAFSYAATGNGFNSLSAPLVQKGNPANGMGATSGINFMNPNSGAATVEATWLNPSGYGAANFGSSIVWVPGFATGFVYTMFHSNLPNGYFGSAAVESDLPIVATTANVDYQVDGDGTAIWNLSNPCGFFRQAGECVYESPLEPSPANATLTKTVTAETADFDFDGITAGEGDEDENLYISGVLVNYDGTDENGFPVSGSGFTGSNGSVTFVVPAGTYDITISVPDGYLIGTPSDPGIEVLAGNAVTVVNDLTQAPLEGTGTLTKMLDIDILDFNPQEEGFQAPPMFSLESEVYFCEGIVEDAADCDEEGEAIAFGGYGEMGDAAWMFSADVPAGIYTICTSVFVSADLNNDGVVIPVLETLESEFACETMVVSTVDGEPREGQIVVFPGSETVVTNVFADSILGVIDVYVRDDVSDLPLEGAEVCIAPVGEESLAEFNCVYTDLSGYANFLFIFSDLSFNDAAFVGSGTYVVTVNRFGYEQESTVENYNVVEDASDGTLYDLFLLNLLLPIGSPDVVVSLDPQADMGILNVSADLADVTNPDPDEAIITYLVSVAVGTISVYESAAGDSAAGCVGTEVLQVPSNLLFFGALVGLIEIDIDLPAGDYCVDGAASLNLENLGIDFQVETFGTTPTTPSTVVASSTTNVDLILTGDFSALLP